MSRVPTFVALLCLCAIARADVYFVRMSGNDASNGRSAATAFATIDHAASVANAGDVVYIGAGTYAEGPRFNRDGTSSAPIRFVGDRTGAMTGDAGTVTLQHSGTVASVTGDHVHIENLTIAGTGGSGPSRVVDWDGAAGGVLSSVTIRNAQNDLVHIANGATLRIENAVIEGSGSRGVRVLGGSVTLFNTTLSNIPGTAVEAFNSGSFVTAHRIRITGPAEVGIRAESGDAIVFDSIIELADVGIHAQTSSSSVFFVNGTITRTATACATVENGMILLLGAIASDCGGYAINNRQGRAWDIRSMLHDPAGGPLTSGSISTNARITDDPRFLDAASANYRLAPGSPAIDSGWTSPATYDYYGFTPNDLDGFPRDASTGFERGAHEYGFTPAALPYDNDFETSDTTGWYNATIDTHSVLTTHLGPYNGKPAGKETTTLYLETEPGRSYELRFDLFIKGTDYWDGSRPGTAAPDSVLVEVNGDTVFSETFATGNSPQSYTGERDADASATRRHVYRDITLNFQATAAITSIRWLSDVTGTEEDFGIDNVRVNVFDPPCTAGLVAEWIWGFSMPADNSVLNLDFSTPQLVTNERIIDWDVPGSEPFIDGVPTDYFAVRLAGYLHIPEAGDWGFRTYSDDGSVVHINGVMVVDNDGLHSPRYRSGSATLSEGAHTLDVRMYERSGNHKLVFEWQRPGSSAWEVVPESALCSFQPMFTDISANAGFTVTVADDQHDGAGVIPADLEGDGYIDAIITGSEARIFDNDGSGLWIPLGFPSYTPSRQAAILDLDNDGTLDIWATRASSSNREGVWMTSELGSRVWQGDLGLSAPSNNEGAAAIDADADGLIDVAMFSQNGNALGMNQGPPEPLGLDPVTLEPPDPATTGLNGSGNAGDGDFVSAADINSDGHLDLLYNYNSGRLFLSNGDGTFTRDNRGISYHTGNTSKIGVAWGDYDNDGDMDAFVPDARPGQPGRLFRNNGATFTNVATAAGITDTSEQRSAAWGDADNDGNLDLYITTRSSTPNILYLNQSDGTFARGTATGADIGGISHDACFADIDNDGDLDLIVARESAPAALLRNNINGTASLQVGFIGAGSRGTNAAGVGVRVELFDEAGSFIARRELGVARGHGGTEPLRAHFGGVDPNATYTVRFTTPGGDTHQQTVVPAETSATFGNTTVPRMLLFTEPATTGLRIVRWREISPVDGE